MRYTLFCSEFNASTDFDIKTMIPKSFIGVTILIMLISMRLAADDLAGLSDEFNDASSLLKWKRVDEVEKWGANQLEQFDIGKSRSGMMTMIPYTSVWYQDYRGILVFKEIEGDFVVTTELEVNRRNGDGAPRSQFSLAGIMIRAPRKITPETWKPGGENYIFLSLGSADSPGVFQFEVKTTINSDSQLQISDGEAHSVIQVARIGAHVITLKKSPEGNWIVHRRFNRPDMPPIMQVGLTCYTDWPTCSRLDPKEHNQSVIKNGNPDLVARFEYVRYHRPQIPAQWKDANLSDPSVISDAQLLQFLGQKANKPAPEQPSP